MSAVLDQMIDQAMNFQVVLAVYDPAGACATHVQEWLWLASQILGTPAYS